MEADETRGRPLIAWVEDDPDFQAVVRHWLSPHFDLLAYRDGEAFLEDIGELEPDVVMLDVGLPGPDGFALCREIRTRENLRAVPIVFLTCSRKDQDYIRYLDAGGTVYLNKPVDKRRLLSALKGLLRPGVVELPV